MPRTAPPDASCSRTTEEPMTVTIATESPSPLGAMLQNPLPAQLRGATRSFGSIQALSGIDLVIQPGELVSLLGPNGAGKTTAVRMLLGLIAPTSGTARVFGHDPRVAANRERTGAMLQVGRVPETLKVREHL